MQTSLFELGPPLFDCNLGAIERQVLSASAWLDYSPNWLEGAGSVFHALTRDAKWHHQARLMYDRVVAVPRLTARAPSGGTTASLLNAMAICLSNHYQQDLVSISLAWYRDGQDSVAPHADKIGLRYLNPIVAIVSVGSPRRFVLKPNTGGKSQRFSLGWGDLLVMGGTCQRDFVHGVPKSKLAEPRISIMFRPGDTFDEKDDIASNPNFTRSPFAELGR